MDHSDIILAEPFCVFMQIHIRPVKAKEELNSCMEQGMFVNEPAKIWPLPQTSIP